MRRPVLLAACAAAVAFAAHAQQPPSLNWPTLAQCQNPNHPTLPPIWSGTYLLQPYLQPEAQSPGISVMELTVDTTVPAMLMTVAGSEMEGAYLVQGETTYSIVYDMQGNPVGCGSIGDTGLRVLSQDLLSNAAVCAAPYRARHRGGLVEDAGGPAPAERSHGLELDLVPPVGLLADADDVQPA